MKTKIKFTIGLLLFCIIGFAQAAISIPMYNTKTKQFIGNVIATKSPYGVIFTPHLKDLPPGIHGFHIHTNPSCADSGKAAGGHLDPAKTDMHLGPYNPNGHLGDLPVLIVNNKGEAAIPILAPKLTLDVIQGHSLMIHAGGDNYSDSPKKLGGGGMRIACGVIGKKTILNLD